MWQSTQPAQTTAYSSSNHATYTRSTINMPDNLKEGLTNMLARCLVQVLLFVQ
jgi:hypothetical protein